MPEAEEKPHAPSVIDGIIRRTSVSQIQNHLVCPTKWHFDKVQHVDRGPPGKGALRGIEGHSRIAHYLKTGQNVLDKLEQLGIERGLIPAPHPSLMVEHEFGEELKADGVPFSGFIDLINPHHLSEGLIEITDWKFKKDFKFEASAEALYDPKQEAGIQMIAYAEFVRRRFPNVKVINLRHVTFKTRGGRDVNETGIDISVDKVARLWLEVERNLPLMKLTAKQAPLETKRNLNACDKYGGCPYKSKCLDPGVRLAMLFRKSQGNQKVEAASNPQEPTKMGLFSKKAAEAAISAAIPAPEKVYVPSAVTQAKAMIIDVQPGETDEQALARVRAAQHPTILPPDAPKSAPGAQVPTQSSTQPQTPAGVAPAVPAVATGGSSGAGVGAVAASAPSDPPKRRGRPPGSKNAPASVPPLVTAEATKPAETLPGNAQGTSVEKWETVKLQGVTPDAFGYGVFLYFGCSPVGVATKLLTGYTTELERVLLGMLQVNAVDVRISAHEALGFGKWKASLAAAALESPPEPGHYLVTADERTQVIADALAAMLGPGQVVMAGGR